MDEWTKGLSLWGCRMWAHTVKCLTSCQGFPDHMQLNYTTCQITRGSTRRSADAKFHDFFHPLLARLYKQLWKISPETAMPECHANLLLTETLCQLLEKATLARLMSNCLTKILLILDWCSAYLTVLTERELCTITCPWQTDACCTFYRTHYLQL